MTVGSWFDSCLWSPRRWSQVLQHTVWLAAVCLHFKSSVFFCLHLTSFVWVKWSYRIKKVQVALLVAIALVLLLTTNVKSGRWNNYRCKVAEFKNSQTKGFLHYLLYLWMCCSLFCISKCLILWFLPTIAINMCILACFKYLLHDVCRFYCCVC